MNIELLNIFKAFILNFSNINFFDLIRAFGIFTFAFEFLPKRPRRFPTLTHFLKRIPKKRLSKTLRYDIFEEFEKKRKFLLHMKKKMKMRCYKYLH